MKIIKYVYSYIQFAKCDYILKNNKNLIGKIYVIKYDISDHLPVFAMCNITADKQDLNSNVFYRPIRDHKKELFIETFSKIYSNMPNLISESTDPDCDLSNLLDAIRLASHKIFPILKKGKKKQKKSKALDDQGYFDLYQNKKSS